MKRTERENVQTVIYSLFPLNAFKMLPLKKKWNIECSISITGRHLSTWWNAFDWPHGLYWKDFDYWHQIRDVGFLFYVFFLISYIWKDKFISTLFIPPTLLWASLQQPRAQLPFNHFLHSCWRKEPIFICSALS